MQPEEEGTDGGQQDEDEENEQHQAIELQVDVGPLESRFAAVLHELCVKAGEDDEAVDQLGVAKLAAPERHMLVVQRDLCPPQGVNRLVANGQ